MAIEPHVPRELRPSHPKVPFDKGHTTRRLCSFGLFFSIIVGIAFIVLGFVSKGSGNAFNFPLIGKELVALSINIVITACTECLGLIHGTSLKWVLFYEGRLEFNANLRLTSSCRNSWPHSRIVNFVYLLSLTLCYAASPTVLLAPGFYPRNVTDPYVLMRAGPVCLGGALLTLCTICCWSMRATRIPTWEFNPLTILAAAQMGRLEAHQGRCMQSVHGRFLPAEQVYPQRSQWSAIAAHHQIRNVLLAMSVSLGAFLIWAAITFWRACIGSACQPFTAQYLSLFPTAFFQNSTNTSTPSVQMSFFADDSYYGFDVMIFEDILFTMTLQSFISVGLHCAELQVTLSRDEAV